MPRHHARHGPQRASVSFKKAQITCRTRLQTRRNPPANSFHLPARSLRALHLVSSRQHRVFNGQSFRWPVRRPWSRSRSRRRPHPRAPDASWRQSHQRWRMMMTTQR